MDQFNSAPGRAAEPGVLTRVRERAGAELSARKNRATEGLGTIAEGARQTTRQLREQRHESLASYVEKAADHLERVSAQLKEKNIGELVDDVQKFARRRPAVFIGSAFAMGFLCSHWLRSSTPASEDVSSAPQVTERTGHEWTEKLR